MKFLFPLVLLVIATSLEASGDAIIRIGLKQPHTIPVRVLLMLAGAAILYGYGLTLNLSPLDWGRLIGAYVATFFVVGTDHQSWSCSARLRPCQSSLAAYSSPAVRGGPS